MKNTLLILSFLFPALAFGQFGLGNPNRTLTELGRQTTARGIVYYASGPPNTVITYRPNRDTAAYMWVDTLTSRRYEWNHTGNFWATQGIVSGASAPAATQTNGPALIDNRDAFFRSTVDNLFYFYDRTNLTWAEFGSGGGATCGDCPVTTSDPISGDGTTGNPLTLKGYSSATAGQYPVKNAGTGFAWNTVGLDTFAIVSNTLRASIYGDNVPFKSVSLAPYLDNTDAQNLTINGTSAPYVLAISGGSDVEFDEGVGIGLNESPANTLVITNTLPDVTVSLTGAGINNVTGTYPNFTITGTEVDGSTTNELQNLSLTGQALGISSGSGVTLPMVGVSAGAGISVSTSSGVATVTNTGDTNAADDLTASSTAGGDLSGTYPNPTVDGLQGVSVSATSPTSGQVLKYNGTAWAPAAESGGGATDLTFSGSSSPFTLNSSTGTDVTIKAGTNVTLTRSTNELTIAAVGGGGGDGNGIYDGSGAIPDATHAKLAGEFTTFFLDYNNDAPAFSIDPDAVGGVSIYDPSSANYFTITSGGITFTGPAGGLSIDQIGFVMSSTIAAFYAPKMTTTQRDAISGVASPTEGAIIYNLTIHKLQVYDGTTWQSAW